MEMYNLERKEPVDFLMDCIRKRGLTYRYVALITGVGRATLHSWLYSKNSPRIDTFCGCLSKLGYELVIRNKATNQIEMGP